MGHSLSSCLAHAPIKMGVRACASWPAILLCIFNFIMVALVMVETFIPRYSHNMNNANYPKGRYYLTHYFYRSTPDTSFTFFDDGYEFDSFDTCHYDGDHFWSDAQANCPARVRTSAILVPFETLRILRLMIYIRNNRFMILMCAKIYLCAFLAIPECL